MKSRFGLMFFSIIAILIAFVASSTVLAAVSLPTYVRIGLYYKGASSGAHSQTSCFQINAVQGLDVGYNDGKGYKVLYELKNSNLLTLRKDKYYVQNYKTFTEYNPSDSNIPSTGIKIGPYHVQVGGSFSNYTGAKEQVAVLKKAGILAYPVYNDGWFVWTGFYLSQDSALTNMISNITTRIPNISCKVINPSNTRVAIVVGENTLFLYDSTKYKLRIRARVENSPRLFKINSSNSQRYRGTLEVLRLTTSDMTLVNIIKLDEYLYGVVPSEMPASSNLEALKAQAIVARTYAYNSLKKHSSLNFDLCPTTHCHVYLGYNNEYESTNTAVSQTKGKIITYQDAAAKVFYSASDGGKTEDVKNVWGSTYPYLISVDDPYEPDNFTWSVERTPAYIKSKIASWGYSSIGTIVGVKITKKSKAGRATEVLITGSTGTKTFKLENCRLIFGLQSQWFSVKTPEDTYFRRNGGTVSVKPFTGMTVVSASGKTKLVGVNGMVTMINGAKNKKNVSIKPDVFIFKGRGNGHAVGMSQEGAMAMGKLGKTSEEIILHYFPGTKIS